jgi:hypothetical protein
MTSVTFSAGVGGDGSTVTDDANATTGLANGGHRTRFVPALAQVVAVAAHVVTKAGEANDDAAAAAGSQSAAAASALAASGSADAAAAAAAAAANLAAGVTATSTTSLTIGTGSKSLTVQTGKQFAAGQFVIAANTTDPAKYMWGPVTSYNSGTGALVIDSQVTAGSGTLASWVVSIAGARGARGETGTGVTDQATGWKATGGTTPKTLTVDEDLMASSIGRCVRVARTSNTMLTASDRGKLIDITSGTFSQTVDAAATLGSGWWVYFRNAGTGTVTIDPSGADTIDGMATGVAMPGCTYLLVCDGAGLHAVKVDGCVVNMYGTGTSWTAPMGVRSVKARLQGAGGSGGKGGDGVTCFPGGAGGGYLEKTLVVVPGTAYSYSVGSGGNAIATTNSNGVAGGNTTLTVNGIPYTATGGAGGGTAAQIPSLGGGATNGDINVPGGNSRVGTAYFASSRLDASAGGDSVLGRGGQPATNLNTGNAATGFGSGGHGATANFNSGAGTQGIIILEY